MNISRMLVEHARAVSHDALPEEARDRARYFLLDHLGVALRAVEAASSRVLHNFARKRAPKEGPCTIIGSDMRTDAPHAALVNGGVSHATEMDDVTTRSSLHPGVSVMPTALAVAEMRRSGPKEVIAAIVAGYETANRIGNALNPTSHYERGFHPTGTCGAFAAAIVASKLLGLSVEATANAMGIAGSQAAGSMQYLDNGAWTKRFHPGWAAHSGVMAACLAQEGYTGPEDILGGKTGFLRGHSDDCAPECVVERLGEYVDHRDRAPTHKAVYHAERLDYDFRGADAPRAVALRWRGPDGLEVRKTYRFAPGSYLIGVEHELRNGSAGEWVGRQYRQLRRSAGRAPDRTSALFGNTQALSFIGAAYHDAETYHKLSFDDLEEQEFAQTYTDGWIALLQHYFVSAWIPARGEAEHYYTRVIRGDRYPEYIIGMHSPAARVAPGGRAEFATQLYVGPKEQNRLAAIADGLDLTVDYGILTVLSKPLFWVLDWIYALVGNWGWAIVLLTVLIKLAFYKLSETSYRSMAKMRKFAPRFQQLRERYADDRAKLNEAMMKLYREEKVNPLGGCWPILVQIPVFIALYWVLLESVELRQAPFVGWVQDLSVRDPYYVLPVLMGASMIVQTKLNPTPPDPFQAKLMMALPVVFTVFFLFFPAGLVLYWLVNNLLSIAQQWYIIRRMGA